MASKKRGRRPAEQTDVRTKLAAWRVRRGVTQKELAEATGIPLSTLWRLERGLMRHPPIPYLVNCAIALGCALDDLIEDEMLRWHQLSVRAAKPPNPMKFWRTKSG